MVQHETFAEQRERSVHGSNHGSKWCLDQITTMGRTYYGSDVIYGCSSSGCYCRRALGSEKSMEARQKSVAQVRRYDRLFHRPSALCGLVLTRHGMSHTVCRLKSTRFSFVELVGEVVFALNKSLAHANCYISGLGSTFRRSSPEHTTSGLQAQLKSTRGSLKP